jgi:hypothetical protein
VVRHNLVNVCFAGDFYKVSGLKDVDAVESFDGAEVVQWVLHSGFDFLDGVLAVRRVGGCDCKIVDLS